MPKLLILDTETTGLQEPRLVQLAYKGCGYDGGGTLICNDKFRPAKPIEYGAMAICHITNEDVADLEPFGEKDRKTLQGLLNDHVLIAHNAPYDIGVLKAEGVETFKYIDTKRVAEHLLDYKGGYSMQELRYAYGLDIKDKDSVVAHDAWGDIIVLESLFYYLKRQVKGTDPIAEMVKLSQTPILLKVAKFGKHKGKAWADIAVQDLGYLKWLFDSESKKDKLEQNTDLIHTLNYYLN